MSLELTDIVAGYGPVDVLHGVGVTVHPGEVVALIGPNGAGKTTLLRVASGLIRPRAGAVRLDGVDLTGVAVERVARLGIAHVPEGRRLFAGLTVADNLRLGGWYRRDRDLSRVLALFPGLGERLGQVAGSLSGGEQQMCAIGRAMMMRPRFLLVDELSLGLAPLVVDEILASLSGIAAGGTAILLVEQDAGAALEVSHRAYVLENGRIAMQGSAGELATDPRVQAAYLGP
jgi:branched-chain amino acid transport system ATP-binding protein